MHPKQFTFGYLLIATLVGVGCITPQIVWAEIEPAVVREGKVELSPKNCWIEWVGTHVGPVPDPDARKGTFAEFKGLALVDPTSQSLKSLTLEIKTSSLQTPIPKLTNHLKSPDFFDVREYPTAKFVSKAIQAKDSTQVEVVGDLTLHGVTREIRIPTDLRFDGQELSLRGQLTLDRTQFGMDQLTDRVSKEVQLNFRVGPANSTSAEKSSARNPRGVGQTNPPDPATRFKERDRDRDGKLTGDEIPPRIKAELETYDADGDGSVSLEEIKPRMRRGSITDGTAAVRESPRLEPHPVQGL